MSTNTSMSEKAVRLQHMSRDEQDLPMAKKESLSSSIIWLPIVRLLQLGALALALIVFLRMSLFDPATTLTKPLSSSQMIVDPHHLLHPKIQYKKCSEVVTSTTKHFEYNVTAPETAAQEWRFRDTSGPESRKSLRGGVKVNRGDPLQVSDIEVRVVIRSNHQKDSQNVLLEPSESALDLHYDFTDRDDICTEVQVLIFLRPWPKRLLEVFEIRSEALDIEILPSLVWEVNNLITHTSYGDSTFAGTHMPDPMITHNVSASSVSGVIFGWYTADGILELHSESGLIGFYLVPRYTRSLKPESISISTKSGDIDVRGIPWEHWPSNMEPFTHITNIHTKSGKIWTYIPHGSFTNISSMTGDIATYLKPFGATSPDDRSEIYTTLQSGRTRVHLANTDQDSLEGHYDPLLNTTSMHQVSNGRLELSYPFSWFGNMEAHIEHGPLTFDASWLDEIERGEGYVKAKRGEGGGESQLEARVGNGELDIKIGL